MDANEPSHSSIKGLSICVHPLAQTRETTRFVLLHNRHRQLVYFELDLVGEEQLSFGVSINDHKRIATGFETVELRE